jgi:hypothetical protein
VFFAGFLILWLFVWCNAVKAQTVVSVSDSNLINLKTLKGDATDSTKSETKTEKIVKDKSKFSNVGFEDSSLLKKKLPTTILKKGNDSLCFKKKILKKTSTKGSISMGYDYGIIPFTTNMKMPDGFYKTEGNAGFEIFNFPINVTFYYSAMQSISGLNNYFKISYDVNKYKENLKDKVNDKVKAFGKSLDSLYNVKQKAEQKELYFETLAGSVNHQMTPEQYLNYKNKHLKLGLNDTTEFSLSENIQVPDSIKNKGSIFNKELSDSIKMSSNTANDSVAYFKNLSKKSDSLMSKVSEYKNKIKKYVEEINKIKKAIEELKSTQNLNTSMLADSNYIPKYKRPSFALKKFEIGLCYPNYSTFLVSSATVKGVNIEVEKPDFYYAFTYGKTINTLMMNNNILQNSMQKIKNMLDFFDFNDVSTSRRITVFKMGYGKREATHLHAGILYGTGLTSYMSDISVLDITQNKERNYVVELDGRWVINSNNAIDLVYGKSSVQQQDQSLSGYDKGFYGIFQPVRSNAAQAAYKTSIKKTKTKLTFTSRWVDPFFKSYGVGFLRADNLRYEIKAEQPINKKIKLTGFYRKGEDNLLSLYSYKSTIQTIGAKINIKLTHCWSMHFGYNPILQTIRTSENKSIINRNNITTGVITFTPKAKRFYSVFNVLYSYYNISDSLKNNVFRNISFVGSSQISNSFKNNLSAGWLYAKSTDSLNTNTILMTDEISYSFLKKAELSIIGKYAITPDTTGQLGFGIKVNIPLMKRLSAEGSFERVVIGDFYSYYDSEQLKKFPYYCYFKLIYTW